MAERVQNQSDLRLRIEIREEFPISHRRISIKDTTHTCAIVRFSVSLFLHRVTYMFALFSSRLINPI